MEVSLWEAVILKIKNQGPDQILISLGIDDLRATKTPIELDHHNLNTQEEDYKGTDYRHVNIIQKGVDNTESVMRHDQILTQIEAIVAFDENLVKCSLYVLLFCTDFWDKRIDVTLKTSREETQESSILTTLGQYVFSSYSAFTVCGNVGILA